MMEDADDPSLWRTATDPNSGKTYWYHKKTRNSTWEMPLCLQQTASSASRITTTATTTTASKPQQQQLQQQQQNNARLTTSSSIEDYSGGHVQHGGALSTSSSSSSSSSSAIGIGIASRQPTSSSSSNTSSYSSTSSSSSSYISGGARIPVPATKVSNSLPPSQGLYVQQQGFDLMQIAQEQDQDQEPTKFSSNYTTSSTTATKNNINTNTAINNNYNQNNTPSSMKTNYEINSNPNAISSATALGGQKLQHAATSMAPKLDKNRIDLIIENLMVSSPLDSYLSCIELSKLLTPSRVEIITVAAADSIITALVGLIIRSASSLPQLNSIKAAAGASSSLSEAMALLYNHKILAYQCLFSLATNPKLVHCFVTNQSWIHLFSYIDSSSSNKVACADKECRLLFCGIVSFLYCSPVVGVLDDNKVEHYLTTWIALLCDEMLPAPSAGRNESRLGIMTEMSFDAVFSRSVDDFPSFLNCAVLSCFTEIAVRGHVLSAYVVVVVITACVRLGAKYWDLIDTSAITCLLRLLSCQNTPSDLRVKVRALCLLVMDAVPSSRQVLLDAYSNVTSDLLLLSMRSFKDGLDENSFSKSDPRIVFGLNRKEDDLGLEDFDNSNTDDSINEEVNENESEVYAPIGDRLEKYIYRDVEWRPLTGASWQLSSSLLWIRCPGLRETIGEFWDSNASNAENSGNNGLFLQAGCSSWSLDVITTYLHSGLIARPLRSAEDAMKDKHSFSRFLFYRCLEIAKISNELGLDPLLNSVILIIADCVRRDDSPNHEIRSVVLEFSRNFEIVKLEDLILNDDIGLVGGGYGVEMGNDARMSPSNYRGFETLVPSGKSNASYERGSRVKVASTNRLELPLAEDIEVVDDDDGLGINSNSNSNNNYEGYNDLMNDAVDELSGPFNETMSLKDAVMMSLQDVSNILNVPSAKQATGASASASASSSSSSLTSASSVSSMSQNTTSYSSYSSSGERRPPTSAVGSITNHSSSSPSSSSSLTSNASNLSSVSSNFSSLNPSGSGSGRGNATGTPMSARSTTSGPIKNKSGGIYSLLLEDMGDEGGGGGGSGGGGAMNKGRQSSTSTTNSKTNAKQLKQTGSKSKASADQSNLILPEYSNSMSLIPTKQPVLSEREKRLMDIAKPKSQQMEEKLKKISLASNKDGDQFGNNSRENSFDNSDEHKYRGGGGGSGEDYGDDEIEAEDYDVDGAGLNDNENVIDEDGNGNGDNENDDDYYSASGLRAGSGNGGGISQGRSRSADGDDADVGNNSKNATSGGKGGSKAAGSNKPAAARKLPYSQLPNQVKVFVDWFANRLHLSVSAAQDFVNILANYDVSSVEELKKSLLTDASFLSNIGAGGGGGGGPFDKSIEDKIKVALSIILKSTTTTTASSEGSSDSNKGSSSSSSNNNKSSATNPNSRAANTTISTVPSTSASGPVSNGLRSSASVSNTDPIVDVDTSASASNGVKSSLALLKSKRMALKMGGGGGSGGGGSETASPPVPILPAIAVSQGGIFPSNSNNSNNANSRSTNSNANANANATTTSNNSNNSNNNFSSQKHQQINRNSQNAWGGDKSAHDQPQNNAADGDDGDDDDGNEGAYREDGDNSDGNNDYNEEEEEEEEGEEEEDDDEDDGKYNSRYANNDEAFLAPDGSSISNITLTPCEHCGRKFSADALKKHFKICEKVFLKKRKVFDSSKMRINAVPELQEMNKQMSKSKKNVKTSGKGGQATSSSTSTGATGAPQSKEDKAALWKLQSEQFRAAMRAARDYNTEKAGGGGGGGGGGSSQSQAPVAAPYVDPSLVMCNNCGRKFNQKAADRHIPLCKSIQNKPKPLKKGSGVGGGVTSTGTTFNAGLSSSTGGGSFGFGSQAPTNPSRPSTRR